MTDGKKLAEALGEIDPKLAARGDIFGEGRKSPRFYIAGVFRWAAAAAVLVVLLGVFTFMSGAPAVIRPGSTGESEVKEDEQRAEMTRFMESEVSRMEDEQRAEMTRFTLQFPTREDWETAMQQEPGSTLAREGCVSALHEVLQRELGSERELSSSPWGEENEEERKLKEDYELSAVGCYDENDVFQALVLEGMPKQQGSGHGFMMIAAPAQGTLNLEIPEGSARREEQSPWGDTITTAYWQEPVQFSMNADEKTTFVGMSITDAYAMRFSLPDGEAFALGWATGEEEQEKLCDALSRLCRMSLDPEHPLSLAKLKKGSDGVSVSASVIPDGQDLWETADAMSPAQVAEWYARLLYEGENGNIISCFLASYYADARGIDLIEFLRYCPLAQEVTDEQEYQALKAANLQESFWQESLAQMAVPLWRYPAQEVDSALQKWAGIGLEDLSLSRDWKHSALLYSEEYDAFYNFTSDWGPAFFTPVSGKREGDRVILRSQSAELCLQELEDGDFRFVYHIQLPEGDDGQESSPETLAQAVRKDEHIAPLVEAFVEDPAAWWDWFDNSLSPQQQEDVASWLVMVSANYDQPYDALPVNWNPLQSWQQNRAMTQAEQEALEEALRETEAQVYSEDDSAG